MSQQAQNVCGSGEMGNRSFHLEKARRNEDFYHNCGPAIATAPEWGAVLLFYASLHYVDAILADNNIPDPESHKARNDLVNAITILSPVQIYYRVLYWRSLEARYTRVSLSISDVHNLETLPFQALRRHVRENLGLNTDWRTRF